MKKYVASIQSGCIFPSHICLKDQPIVTFIRANVTAEDIGINGKSKMTVSHRILCSPISLNQFIHKSPLPADSVPDYGNFTLSIQDPLTYNATESSLGLQLNMWTENGPDSGLEMFRRKSALSIHILPASDSNNTLEISRQLHPLLKFANAQTFILILKAGGIFYSSASPIIDPFFEARNLGPVPIYYIADREATGIGCGEQTQICIEFRSGVKCYPWTKGLRDYPETLFRDFRQFNDTDTILEYMTVFWRSLESSSGENSPQAFLRRRFLYPDSLLAKGLVIDPLRFSLIRDIDSERQWVAELEALFNKANYYQKISTLAIARNNIDREKDKIYAWNYSLCDKIFFIDADFTNINWIGMWITITVLLVVCIISYGISLLEWASQSRVSLMSRVQTKMAKICEMPTATSAWVRKKLGKVRNQDVAVDLSTLPAQAPRPSHEEPDDPI